MNTYGGNAFNEKSRNIAYFCVQIHYKTDKKRTYLGLAYIGHRQIKPEKISASFNTHYLNVNFQINFQ